MRTELNNYYVFPSVVKSGVETTVRILPRAEQARFDNRFVYRSWGEVATKQRFPDEWFTHDSSAVCMVTVCPMRAGRNPMVHTFCDRFPVQVDADGGLTIRYLFEQEQEYELKVSSPLDHDSFRYTFSVYCVEEDLFGKRAYKGDLHVHSIYSDGVESPEVNAANYRKAGFDFFALTDHFKRFPSLMLQKQTDAHDFGLRVFPGEEVHVPDVRFHYVHVGGDWSVNEWYADHPEQYEAEYRAIYDSLPFEDETVREFAARLTWMDRTIKKAGGLSIYTHPHWRWVSCQNIPDKVSAYIFENGLMDAFELLGGQTVAENNTQLAMYMDYAAEGKRYPLVASSDSHQSEAETLFNQLYTIVFAPDSSFESVKNAILRRENIAAEHVADFRAYGKLRYVFYAQFLWARYFPQYEELCLNVGINMKSFFEGHREALESALSAQQRADCFAEAFFNRAEF